MHNTKLITLLKSLSKTELKALKNFLESKFSGTSKRVVRLFDLLRKRHPDWLEKELEPSYLFYKIFGKGKVFNDHALRKLRSELVQNIEDFLIYSELEKKPFLKKKLLIQSLGVHNLYKLFKKESETCINDLQILEVKDDDNFHELNKLNWSLYEHIETPKYQLNGHFVVQALDNLENSYLINKLKLLYELQERYRKFKEPHEISLLNEVGKLDKKRIYDNPVAFLYWKFIQLNEGAINLEKFRSILNLYQQYHSNLKPPLKRAFFVYLINYTIRAINEGHLFFKEVQLECYQYGDKQELLTLNGKISRSTFVNIITLAAYLKKHTWLSQFIERNAPLLDESYRTVTLNFANAYLYFSQKKFEAAAELLFKTKFSKPGFKLLSKTLEARSRYEYYNQYEEYESLKNKMDAFEKYVTKEKGLVEQNRLAYKNFILIMKNMLQWKVSGRYSENKFLTAIQKIEQEPIIAKNWLLEKMKHFKENKKNQGLAITKP